jgi:hypothetical protein
MAQLPVFLSSSMHLAPALLAEASKGEQHQEHEQDHEGD